jgi:Ca-activated chloride channel family protein
VTLLKPWHLLLLVGVGALAAMYVVLLVRRRSYAARFANPSMIGLLAPRRSAWGRTAAVCVMLGALVVAVVGLARPARAERVSRKEATIMLAIDVSPSMEATDVTPSRLVAAQKAASEFVRQLPNDFRVGVVSFAGTARVAAAPTTDRAAVLDTLANLHTDRGTAAGDAILAALNAIGAANPATGSGTNGANGGTKVQGQPARIVLLSDGLASVGGAGTPIPQAIDAARQAGVPVSTISFGTPSGVIQFDGAPLAVPVDGALLSQIARDTGGTAFQAATASELRQVYQDVGRRITYTVHQRDLTMLFVGVALALALAGLTSSLVTTARIA